MEVLHVVILAALVMCSVQLEFLVPDKDICRLFKDDVKLRKPGTCSEAIICKNFTSVAYEDCGDKIWDKNAYKCVKSTKDKYCGRACSKNSPQFVNDQKNCYGWNECSGGSVISHGVCPNGLHFNQQEQLCVYPEQSQCVASFELCDVVPTGIMFQDEDNCHKYYQCKKMLISEECSTGTYFDVKKGSCIAKAQVNCYKHPYPANVCGNHKLAISNQFVSDRATCRGYFYCRELPGLKVDTEPPWGQCAEGLFFEPRQQTCMGNSHVKCTEDRCDGRGNGRTLSSKPGCQHFLVCQNNYTISEEKCNDDMYFDDITGACTEQRTFYGACS